MTFTDTLRATAATPQTHALADMSAAEIVRCIAARDLSFR